MFIKMLTVVNSYNRLSKLYIDALHRLLVSRHEERVAHLREMSREIKLQNEPAILERNSLVDQLAALDKTILDADTDLQEQLKYIREFIPSFSFEHKSVIRHVWKKLKLLEMTAKCVQGYEKTSKNEKYSEQNSIKFFYGKTFPIENRYLFFEKNNHKDLPLARIKTINWQNNTETTYTTGVIDTSKGNGVIYPSVTQKHTLLVGVNNDNPLNESLTFESTFEIVSFEKIKFDLIPKFTGFIEKVGTTVMSYGFPSNFIETVFKTVLPERELQLKTTSDDRAKAVNKSRVVRVVEWNFKTDKIETLSVVGTSVYQNIAIANKANNEFWQNVTEKKNTNVNSAFFFNVCADVADDETGKKTTVDPRPELTFIWLPSNVAPSIYATKGLELFKILYRHKVSSIRGGNVDSRLDAINWCKKYDMGNNCISALLQREITISDILKKSITVSLQNILGSLAVYFSANRTATFDPPRVILVCHVPVHATNTEAEESAFETLQFANDLHTESITAHAALYK